VGGVTQQAGTALPIPVGWIDVAFVSPTTIYFYGVYKVCFYQLILNRHN
jgi:hypothetical protein